MKKLWVFIVILIFLIFSCLLIGVVSRANFEITRYELCSEKQGVIKFHGHVSKRRGKNYLHFNVSIPFPLGDNAGLNCSIQLTRDGKSFVTVHTIHEKNMCKAANLYLGKYWDDIMVAVKVPPKTCPLPAGQYRANGVYLNFDNLALQNFPFGKLRFMMDVVNSSNPSMSYLCVLEEVTNK